MNYRKLAQILLRILGIWLIAQSLSQIAVSLSILLRAVGDSRSSAFGTLIVPYAVAVAVLVGGGILLIALSTRIANAIADET